MRESGLFTEDLNDALENPRQKIAREDGSVVYVGRNATVVLNENSWVVTVWRTGTFR